MNLQDYIKRTGFENPEPVGKNIAILDSGFNTDNENVKFKFNAFTKTDDVSDKRGHGTAIYEIINTISPNSNFYLFKALDDFGKGDMLSIYESLIRCRDIEEIDIICMSFSSFSKLSTSAHDALIDCINNNKIILSALGNDSSNTVTYPSGIDGVYKVGALSADDLSQRYHKSNYSPKTNFVALGENIESNGETREGTSFANAIVVGQIAELMAQHNITKEEFNYELVKQFTNGDVRFMDTAFGELIKPKNKATEPVVESEIPDSEYGTAIQMYRDGFSMSEIDELLIPIGFTAKDFTAKLIENETLKSSTGKSKKKKQNGKRLTEDLKMIISERDSSGVSRSTIIEELGINFVTVRRACEKYGSAKKYAERTNDLDLYEKVDAPIKKVDGGIQCHICKKRANAVDDAFNVYYCPNCFEEYTVRFKKGNEVLYRTRWENVD